MNDLQLTLQITAEAEVTPGTRLKKLRANGRYYARKFFRTLRGA